MDINEKINAVSNNGCFNYPHSWLTLHQSLSKLKIDITKMKSAFTSPTTKQVKCSNDINIIVQEEKKYHNNQLERWFGCFCVRFFFLLNQMKNDRLK